MRYKTRFFSNPTQATGQYSFAMRVLISQWDLQTVHQNLTTFLQLLFLHNYFQLLNHILFYCYTDLFSSSSWKTLKGMTDILMLLTFKMTKEASSYLADF